MRQLLISDGTAVSYTGGLVAPGAIDVVGLSADGPESLTPGDTISDYAAIRLIQGTAAGRANVVSPWIDGSSVSRWVGQSFAAQTAQSSTLTFATVPSAGGTEMSIKVIDRAIGQAQFQRASASYTTVAGTLTVHAVTINLMASLTGLPIASIAATTDYAIPGLDRVVAQVNSISSATVITLTGNTFDSDPYSVLASFQSASENLNGDFGTTLTVASTGTPTLGNGGDGNLIVELEESLQGMGRGYYDRVQLPVVPPAYAVAATSYDLYKLGFGNAAPGSIRGVDNYRELIIASTAGAAGGTAFEGKINPWLASCPGAFGAVNL
tara:strand:+ start:907 stop:1878 length:972 start_codon:yes stop_codon:yes gene_type:complete